jgi:demethylmenaquinone methyltransferase/2-methoxy-6-polyprenyl-1,4-benzoquinol methylase
MSVKPYNSEKSKKEEVAEMFNNISPKYDILNRSLSMGIDVGWRKKAVKKITKLKPNSILDIATGTADLAIALTKTGAREIIGVDISEGMLRVGKKKVAKTSFSDIISLQLADAESLPFEDNKFDVVTVAFGVRNFENPLKGLKEIYRVLKPGGTFLVLEFSKPKVFPVKQVYGFYFKNILPTAGRIVSKDSAAYTYLPASVKAFPEGQEFLNLLSEAGFKQPHAQKLTFGIASIYTSTK